MPRTFITLTQDDIDAKIIENLHSRESELLSYDFEKANHEQAISTLGNISWTEKTTPYKGLTRDAMIVRALADGLTSEEIQQISDLNVLDIHKLNLEAVKVETSKSERHYNSLLDALPAGAQRDTALTTFQAKKSLATSKYP